MRQRGDTGESSTYDRRGKQHDGRLSERMNVGQSTRSELNGNGMGMKKWAGEEKNQRETDSEIWGIAQGAISLALRSPLPSRLPHTLLPLLSYRPAVCSVGLLYSTGCAVSHKERETSQLHTTT